MSKNFMSKEPMSDGFFCMVLCMKLIPTLKMYSRHSVSIDLVFPVGILSS